MIQLGKDARRGPVVAPEVAERIVARCAAGGSVSEITGSLHMTPGEVRAVLRAGRVAAPEVAAPVIVPRPVGQMLLAAIRGRAVSVWLSGPSLVVQMPVRPAQSFRPCSGPPRRVRPVWWVVGSVAQRVGVRLAGPVLRCRASVGPVVGRPWRGGWVARWSR